jgi:hypothetical protein
LAGGVKIAVRVNHDKTLSLSKDSTIVAIRGLSASHLGAFCDEKFDADETVLQLIRADYIGPPCLAIDRPVEPDMKLL